jgi:hypothetical protein
MSEDHKDVVDTCGSSGYRVIAGGIADSERECTDNFDFLVSFEESARRDKTSINSKTSLVRTKLRYYTRSWTTLGHNDRRLDYHQGRGRRSDEETQHKGY